MFKKAQKPEPGLRKTDSMFKEVKTRKNINSNF